MPPDTNGTTLPAFPRHGTIVDTAASEAGDDLMTSVTTIIGILDKPALIPWAVNETADRLIDAPAKLLWYIENEGPEAARRWIAGLRYATGGLLSDAARGTLLHALADQWMLLGFRPDVTPDLHPDYAAKGSVLLPADIAILGRMLDQFDRVWLQQWQPEYIASEFVVFHDVFKYAGQVDAIVRINGKLYVIDYKTSKSTYTAGGKLKGVYPEIALQLSAYRHATHAAVYRVRRTERYRRRYYLLNAAERAEALPMPEVDGGMGVFVSPDHLGVHAVRCDDDVFRVYCNLQEVARWQHDWSDSCVGNPMSPPYPVDDDDPFAGLPQE